MYTVANESRYLLVFGVPKINLVNEVRREFQKFGNVESVENVSSELLKKGIGNFPHFNNSIKSLR